MRAWWVSVAVVACNNSVPSRPAPPATASASVEPSPAPLAASSTADTAGPDDAISRKVASLDPHGLWTNGVSPKIDLPSTASTAEVLALMFTRVSFDRGPAKTHRVSTERDVRVGLDPMPYRVVLVETDVGQKIVFLRYEAESRGWWTRVYDVK